MARAKAFSRLLRGAVVGVLIGVGLAVPILAAAGALSAPTSPDMVGPAGELRAAASVDGGITAFVTVAADSDGDGVLDAVDNCPTTPNPSQANADGDAFGDACDACPSVSTPWFTPVGDSDCDGFTTTDENFIGTDPNLACGLAAWPPDFNDDTFTNVLDLDILKPALFSTGPNPPYHVRLDLKPDNTISVFDLDRMKPFFFLSCTP